MEKKWIKPAGVSKYHLFGEEGTLCGKAFVVDSRSQESKERPANACEVCKEVFQSKLKEVN